MAIKHFLFRTFLFLFIALFPFLAVAQSGNSGANEKYVSIRAIADQVNVQGGETITIGLEKTIVPGWHTYWLNPGDSGAPATIEWDVLGDAPEDFIFSSEFEWPVPSKIPYGPLMNYGYEGQIVLLQDLNLPETLPEGPITLNGRVDILVCEEICIPESHDVSLTLNPEADNVDDSALIDQARKTLPQERGWKAEFGEEQSNLVLSVTPDDISLFERADTVELFFEDWGLVSYPAPESVSIEGEKLVIRQLRGERDLSEIPMTRAVLKVSNADGPLDDSVQGYRISAGPAPIQNGSAAPLSSSEDGSSNTGLAKAILFALIGGLILNLMPCVFPVLSMKALSLVHMKDKDAGKARLYGLSYTGGILVSFLGIAGSLILLKSFGAEIGWGFQLQNPVVIGLLAYLLFVIGLNLSGLFEITGSFTNFGSKLTQKNDATGSFFTGVLATLVATPCTAPFMAVALGFALTQPAFISLIVFAALGLGLALPYLILCFVPAAREVLPKPGPWMEKFKEFLAFPMFISAAWLVWIFSQQAGTTPAFYLLLGMIGLAFAFWSLKASKDTKIMRHICVFLSLVLVLIAGAILFSPTASDMEMKEAGVYSKTYLEEILTGDNPVFVNMTAAWCITCKVNERIALSIDSTKQIFSEQNVVYLKGDWTNQDPEITKYLDSFGRSGVPLYVYYGPRDKETGQRPEPVVLPQILTSGIVKNAILGTQ